MTSHLDATVAPPACRSNPCRNGGTCTAAAADAAGTGFECQCVHGLTGRYGGINCERGSLQETLYNLQTSSAV